MCRVLEKWLDHGLIIQSICAQFLLIYKWRAPWLTACTPVDVDLFVLLKKSLAPLTGAFISSCPLLSLWSCCVTAGPAKSREWIYLPFGAYSVHNVGETMGSWRRSPSLMIHIDKKEADERTHKSGMKKKKKIKGRPNLDATVSSSNESREPIQEK